MVKSIIMVAMLRLSLAGLDASADTFRASLYHYPPVAGTDCDGYSASLGTRFAQTYDVRVVESICDWEVSSSRYWTTRIRYEATAALPMISTAETASALAIGGTYKTSEACETARADEMQVFFAKTGIEPFVSYCEPPEYASQLFTLTITAFGSATVRPYVTATSYFGKVLGMTAAAFDQMLKDGFLSTQADLVQWHVEPSLGYGHLKMRYYGLGPIRIEERDIGKMRTANECLSQRDDFAAGVATWAGLSIGVYCHQLFGMGSDIEMVSLLVRDFDVRMVKPMDSYGSFDECITAKPDVIAKYRGSLNRQILAGLCTAHEQGQAYRIVMMEKPKT